MKTKISIALLTLSILGLFSIQSLTYSQTMTCRLIHGSEKTFEDDMVCALYQCPIGEQVQDCIMP